jgi:1,4-alpha-glucan branching enzyme
MLGGVAEVYTYAHMSNHQQVVIESKSIGERMDGRRNTERDSVGTAAITGLRELIAKSPSIYAGHEGQ